MQIPKLSGKSIRTVLLMCISVYISLFLLCSCSPDSKTSDTGLYDVSLVITMDKSITEENSQKIWYWEFMATPMFESIGDEREAAGVVKYWRRLEEFTTDSSGNVKLSGSIGKYTAGQWSYELRALNKRGHVIAVGQSIDYISGTNSNIVSIAVYTDSADGTHGESKDETSRKTGITASDTKGTSTTVRYGTLKIGFLVNQLEYKTDDMRITTTYQKLEKKTNEASAAVAPSLTWISRSDTAKLPAWYVAGEEELPSNTGKPITGDSTTAITEGKMYYETELSLDAGRYLFSFNIEVRHDGGEWKQVGGQTLSTTIVGGEQTEIRGTMSVREYIVAGIIISVPGTIYGSINGKGQIVSTAEKSVTLSWNQTSKQLENSNEKPLRFEWYIEGVKQTENGSTLVFSCPQNKSGEYVYGVYRVSLSPYGENGSWGFSDIDIVFLPD